jgi:hypothetical protein
VYVRLFLTLLLSHCDIDRCMRVSVVLMACLMFACTRANLGFENGAGGRGVGGVGSGGGTGGGGGGPWDLADAIADLSTPSMRDLTLPPDVAPPLCLAGERRCVTAPVASEACSDGQWSSDRLCPFGARQQMNAGCDHGYCAPPTPNGTRCDNGGARENDCVGPGNLGPPFSCQPFITNATKHEVEWWCAIAVMRGTTPAGSPCTSGAECRTGICDGNGTCFRACQSTNDCRGLRNRLVCKPVTIDVEGQALSTMSCAP